MRRSAAVLAGVVLLAVAIVLYANRTPAAYDKPGSRGSKVGGQNVVVVGPKSPTTKVVVYVHGAGETAAGAFGDRNLAPIFGALLEAGYAVAADDAHGDAWGNLASYADYAELVKTLEHRGLSEVYVLARSMGGLNGLQLLSTVAIKAWAGIFPACDLASVYAVGGNFAASIRAAYGPKLAEALRAGSPVHPRYRSSVPMRFWASPGDTVVPKAKNTDVCAAEARKRGAHVKVTTTRGNHGDASNYDPAGVRRLFDAAQ